MVGEVCYMLSPRCVQHKSQGQMQHIRVIFYPCSAAARVVCAATLLLPAVRIAAS